MTDQFNMKVDKPDDVRSLLLEAKRRKDNKIRYHLLGEMLSGKVVNVTKDTGLFEALNRERMDFEQLLKLHPEQAKETVEYVKQRKEEQDGMWYSTTSKAKWGEKGAIPPCCFHARPRSYWENKKLTNNFFNQFTKFRIAESRL